MCTKFQLNIFSGSRDMDPRLFLSFIFQLRSILWSTGINLCNKLCSIEAIELKTGTWPLFKVGNPKNIYHTMLWYYIRKISKFLFCVVEFTWNDPWIKLTCSSKTLLSSLSRCSLSSLSFSSCSAFILASSEIELLLKLKTVPIFNFIYLLIVVLQNVNILNNKEGYQLKYKIEWNLWLEKRYTL